MECIVLLSRHCWQSISPRSEWNNLTETDKLSVCVFDTWIVKKSVFSQHSYSIADRTIKTMQVRDLTQIYVSPWNYLTLKSLGGAENMSWTCHHTSLTFSNKLYLLIYSAEMNLLTLLWKQILILFHIYLDFAQEGKSLTFLKMAAETSTEVAKTAKQFVLKEEVQHAWVWHVLLLSNNYLWVCECRVQNAIEAVCS